MGDRTSARKGSAGITERLREEMHKYLLVSAYLYVCFGAVELYKAAVLEDEGVRYLPLGVAAAKALILGKFLLIGEAAKVGTRLAARSVQQRIVHRAVLLFALLLVLVALEEVISGWIHGRSLATTAGEYASRLPEVLASSLLLLLILVPLVTVMEVSRALGPGGLKRLLHAPPAES
jgi:hypothetical protein